MTKDVIALPPVCEDALWLKDKVEREGITSLTCNPHEAYLLGKEVGAADAINKLKKREDV